MTTATEIMELISNATFTHSPKDWDATQKAIEALEAEKRAAELESNDYRATMMAAAVEIQEHWDAHCDAEGYGPANLMRRLELGSPAGYGYTAQTVVDKNRRIESLEAERNQERALRLDLIERFRAERDALKTKIAEMEKQEPVAWGLKRADGLILDVICPDEHDANEGGYTIPLYLASGAKDASTQMVWPQKRDVGRAEDMGQGHLRILLDSDADVHVEVFDGNRFNSVEFCNPGGNGGGRSTATRRALIDLMLAIESDNAKTPSLSRGPGAKEQP